MSRRRVVVTGLGAISALGTSFEQNWSAMLAGRSGARPIPPERFDATDYRTRFAAIVPDYDPTEFFAAPEARKLDGFTQFALIAADDCVKDSGIDFDAVDPTRAGCVLGTGIGGIMAIQAEHLTQLDRGPRRASPHFIPKMMPNASSARVSLKYGLQGTNYVTSSACSSAGHALGLALRTIQWGEADVVLTGGSEAPVDTLAVASFAAMKALSTRNDDPAGASRPFSADRDGFVMGEGGGAVILESLEHAEARGATILGEVVGYGLSADAFHITAPPPGGYGAQHAMRMAMKYANASAADVDYVNAHGTSTMADAIETEAIKLPVRLWHIVQ